MSNKNKSIEVILVCARCKRERHVAVTQADMAKPPKPCPACGCQEWTQKK